MSPASGPDPLNILEPNLMAPGERESLRDLSDDAYWRSGIGLVFNQSLNPTDADLDAITRPELFNEFAKLQDVKDPSEFPAGSEERAEAEADRLRHRELFTEWADGLVAASFNPDAVRYSNLDSFGDGAALVPIPGLLIAPSAEPRYVTIAENDDRALDGAPVSLHIIEIIPDRYRGAIKVIEGADAFSERITLQHNGELGANTGKLYYEWWIRDAATLDTVATEVLDNGTLTELDARGSSLWQQYIPEERASPTDEDARHLGLHTIVFEGRPDIVLSDKLVLIRH